MKEEIIKKIVGLYQESWKGLDIQELREQMRDLELDHLKISIKDAKNLNKEQLLARLKEQDEYNLNQMPMAQLEQELKLQSMPTY